MLNGEIPMNRSVSKVIYIWKEKVDTHSFFAVPMYMGLPKYYYCDVSDKGNFYDLEFNKLEELCECFNVNIKDVEKLLLLL